MTIPNGWHIKYNPKPIPIRGHDWDFWHDEVDNDSRLCGTAGSEEEAKLAIMEKQAERYGFDKHADKPDDFDSHINIESLQQRIDEQDAEINETMAAHRRLGADLHTALTRIATLEAAISEMTTDPCGEYYTGLRCGVEDRDIVCRYEAAEYGWQQAFEYIGSIAAGYPVEG